MTKSFAGVCEGVSLSEVHAVPRFMLVVSSSDTLLAVSTLDMV